MIEEYIPTGRDNAILLREIAMRSGLSYRDCRRAIEAANNAGACIVNMSDGRGYFQCGPGDDEYKAQYIRQEVARARAIMRKCRRMMTA